MSSEETSIFVLGATGYIGGAVILAIKKKYPSATYVAYTRSSSKRSTLESHGLKVLIPESGEDPLEVIKKAVTFADAVIDCADADDLKVAKAVIAGLEESKKKAPIWIHTSGTGVVTDWENPEGKYHHFANKIWDDSKIDDIKAINPKNLHRDVDLAIFEAAEKGHSINYIVAPSTIYGPALDNPGNKTSDQIPNMIRAAVKRRHTIYVGEGTNLWNNVHIYDLTNLYLLVLNKALAEQATGLITPTSSPYERFYWGSVGEHSWGAVAKALAPILHKKGVVDSDKAKGGIKVDIDPKKSEEPALPFSTGTNSRTVAHRGFKDGWKPTQKSLEETLEEDVEAVLAQM